MVADEGGAAWQRAARDLAPELPGTWVVRGGRGAKAVLIRQPIEWTFAWVGLDRVRVTDSPYLMAGVVSLVQPVFNLSGAPYGLRSDSGEGPKRVNMLSDDAARTIRHFVVDQALPVLDRWSPSALAEAAESNLKLPMAERRPPHFVQAAGWRVVTDTGSPVEPAQQAGQLLKERLAPDEAAWYDTLVEAWLEGGRPSALQYMQEQKQSALTRLKLV